MIKQIKNIPKSDRPREKMEAKGVQSLSNEELLMVILGRGMKGRDVSVLAKKILETKLLFRNRIELKQKGKSFFLGMILFFSTLNRTIPFLII